MAPRFKAPPRATSPRGGFRWVLVLLIAVFGSAGLALSACSEANETEPATKRAAKRQQARQDRAEGRAARVRARRKARAEKRRAGRAAREKQRRERARERRAARAERGAAAKVRMKAVALARSGGDVDCGDFSSQAEAQLHLLEGDPFNLDGDGDGVACASLPCPCSSASGRQSEGGGGSLTGPPTRFRGPVVSVSDGDTLAVRAPGGTVEKIRMIGIDTPEVYGGTECGGPQASAAMKQLARGMVTVSSDPTQNRRDHYGRLLAYINKGSRDLGLTMVRRGLASAYPYDGPFRRYPAYRRAEQSARSAGTGTWARCDISPPG